MLSNSWNSLSIHFALLALVTPAFKTFAQIEGDQSAFVDDRHLHEPGIITPTPQRPEPSSPDNVDTGKPFWEWQHLTDDWNGVRPALDDIGFVIESDLTIDHSHNFDGGISRGSATRHLINFNLTLDTQRLSLWEGGTFFMNFQQIAGPSIGDEVGDVQGASNIDADGRTQLSEIWYEHLMLDDALRIRVGKIDVNGEFAFADNAGEFLNSSMGFSPTIFVMPSYPDPAFGFTVFIYPTDNLYAGFGLFDGSLQEGVPTGSRGPKPLFEGPADLMYIVEAGATWSIAESTLDGRLGLGVWLHDGDFVRFDGGIDDQAIGFYLVMDQMLWRENPDDEDDAQGLAAFIQYGYADEQVSSIVHHLGTGVSWTGVIPHRDEDVLGLGASTGLLSDITGSGLTDDAETALEVFYRLQITPFFAIKPDLQYIINPGGSGADDALVGTIRVEISF